jgi:hypothetical protein
VLSDNSKPASNVSFEEVSPCAAWLNASCALLPLLLLPFKVCHGLAKGIFLRSNVHLETLNSWMLVLNLNRVQIIDKRTVVDPHTRYTDWDPQTNYQGFRYNHSALSPSSSTPTLLARRPQDVVPIARLSQTDVPSASSSGIWLQISGSASHR